MVYRPIAANIAKPAGAVGGYVVRETCARACLTTVASSGRHQPAQSFVAQMTIVTGFAVILALGFLSLALTLPPELWQESPTAKKSKPTAAAPPS